MNKNEKNMSFMKLQRQINHFYGKQTTERIETIRLVNFSNRKKNMN